MELSKCMIFSIMHALKTKDNQFDNFVVTDGTVSCQKLMTTYCAISDKKII